MRGSRMSKVRSKRSPSTVVLVEKDGRFYVYRPELGVIASDASITRAYEKFLASERVLLDDLGQAGLLLERPASAIPDSASPSRSLTYDLGLFLTKACVVFLLIGVIFMIAASMVSNVVENLASPIMSSLERLGHLSINDIAAKVSDIARDAHDMSEERKRQLRDSVGALSREMQPIIDAWQYPRDPSGTEIAPQSTPNKPN
jgi:hypothetical protein